MFKTFITGIVLGIVGVTAALYFLPAVDLDREVSIISVTPNGGNSEIFHINLPNDRVMLGSAEQDEILPAGLSWPDLPLMAGVRTEIFKLRNARDIVIGMASRLVVQNDELGDVVEWVLHIPARGSLFVTLDPAASNGTRFGEMHAGTGEFGTLTGVVAERRVADSGNSEQAADGIIELSASYLAVESVAANTANSEVAE